MHFINPPPTVTAAGYSYSYSLDLERNSVDEYFSSITSIECGKPLYIKVNSTCETLNVYFRKYIASAENAEYIDTVFSLPRKSWNVGSLGKYHILEYNYTTYGSDYCDGGVYILNGVCSNPEESEAGTAAFQIVANPTAVPSHEPTPIPSFEPSYVPTAVPSSEPTPIPSLEPSYVPTAVPSHDPTPGPSFAPTPGPSHPPTPGPTGTRVPTPDPSEYRWPAYSLRQSNANLFGSPVPGGHAAPFCAHGLISNRSSTLGVIWEKQSTADEFVCLVGSEDGNVTAFQNTTSGWVKISDNWFGAATIEDDIMNNNYLQNNDDGSSFNDTDDDSVAEAYYRARLRNASTFDDFNVSSTKPFCADFDNDGLMDCIVGTRSGDTYGFRQTQEGGYEVISTDFFGVYYTKYEEWEGGWESTWGSQTNFTHAAPYCHDWDSDGNLDCLVGYGDGKVALILNAGSTFGRFTDYDVVTYDVFSMELQYENPVPFCLTDLGLFGDGDLDCKFITRHLFAFLLCRNSFPRRTDHFRSYDDLLFPNLSHTPPPSPSVSSRRFCGHERRRHAPLRGRHQLWRPRGKYHNIEEKTHVTFHEQLLRRPGKFLAAENHELHRHGSALCVSVLLLRRI